MKDRVTQYPHRYRLIQVSGQPDIFDIIAASGTITEQGTPLNKANLLSDETASAFGLSGDDATVNKALMNISQSKISCITGTLNASKATVTFDVSVKVVVAGLVMSSWEQYYSAYPTVLFPGTKTAILYPNRPDNVQFMNLSSNGRTLALTAPENIRCTVNYVAFC